MRNIAGQITALLFALAACAGEPNEGDPAPVGDTVERAEAPAPATADTGSAAVDTPAAQAESPPDTPATPEPQATHGAPRADVPPAGDAPVSADQGAQDPAAILRRTAQTYEGIRSLQADFTMRLDNRLLGTSTTSRGTLYQVRPDRILLDFTEPEGDIIVSDGSHFWIYYPSVDPGQVTRAPASAAGTGGVDLQAQFVGDPVERFDYTFHGSENVGGREVWVFTMRPKDPRAGYESLKVWIDAEDSLVRQFELTEGNGSIRHVQLANLQRNPALSDSLFRFTPPDGVRVVDRGSGVN